MIREVLSTDKQGRPTFIVYRETPEEAEARQRSREEQAERGRQVAKSIRQARASGEVSDDGE